MRLLRWLGIGKPAPSAEAAEALEEATRRAEKAKELAARADRLHQALARENAANGFDRIVYKAGRGETT